MMGESATHQRRAFVASLLIAAALCLGVTAAARAMEPAVLLDAELQRHAVQFVSLRDGRLSYFDAERRLTSADAADYVSLRFQHEGDAPAPTEPALARGRLLLADGHDLPGEFAGVNDAGEVIWRHKDLGDLSVSLDDILVLRLSRPGAAAAQADDQPEEEIDARSRERRRRFQPDVHQQVGEDAFNLPGQAEQAPEIEGLADDDEADERDNGVNVPADPHELLVDGADDYVLLRNGDALTGFVEEVDADALHLAVGQQTIPLAWDRIAALALANPARVAAGDWLVLRDGTRVRADDLAISSEQATGEVLGSRALELPARRVRTVEFAQHHRLVTLAELEPRVAAGGVVFGVPMQPSFTREHARLHAPVTVAVDLPAGAKRFTADATLEDETLAWADLELVIRDESGERFRAHLNRDNPHAAVNVPVSGTELVIQLHEAANGPIMDRLRLGDAAILVEQ